MKQEPTPVTERPRRAADAGGDDAADGTPAAPLRTLQAGWDRLGPGETLVVHAGEYVASLVVERSGTPGAPLTVRAADDGPVVLRPPDPGGHDSGLDVRGQSHLRFVGLELAGGYEEAVYLRPGSHHVELVRLAVHGSQMCLLGRGSHDLLVGA